MVAKKKRVKKDPLSMIDAVDHLSGIAELDFPREVEQEEPQVNQYLHRFEILKDREKEEVLFTIRETFKTVHQYLKHVYNKDKEHFKDNTIQQGIKEIMVVADEAADKLHRCTSLFKHTYQEGVISEIKEYNDLKTYFKTKILKRFEQALSSETQWEKKWGSDSKTIDIGVQGLKDLKMVQRDRKYELFYLHNDDNKPFFNRNLLRHIKLVNDFDETIMGFIGEDPLLCIHTLLDHEAQSMGTQIRENAKDAVSDFYAQALSHKDISIVATIFKMNSSLTLASHSDNRVDYTIGKACTHYLRNFHTFLRHILTSADYQRLIGIAVEQTDSLTQTLIHLIHTFSFTFFTCIGNKEDMMEYLNRLIDRAYQQQAPKRLDRITTDHFISELFAIQDGIAEVLKKFPNGPLFKILDTFQQQKEEEGFDPIYQGNLPHYLYTFSSVLFEATCLRIPCPTLHTHINKAKVVAEFKGFLYYFETKKKGNKHLHFNLQNRISWEESTRCKALEELQKTAEVSQQFVLVTMPKNNSFYLQRDNYFNIERSEDFLRLLNEELTLSEAGSFFFSQHIDQNNLFGYLTKVSAIIHTSFFEEKETLLRNERLDFIEIFYLLLQLKIIDMIKPYTFTFSCKDGVDIGSTSSAAFFAFLKLLGNHGKWSVAQQNHLLWILFGPPITVRERLIDNERLSRMASALSRLSHCLTKGYDKILNLLFPLFEKRFFEAIQGKF